MRSLNISLRALHAPLKNRRNTCEMKGKLLEKFNLISRQSVTSRGVITHIVAKWLGSTHNAFIRGNSALCQVAECGGFRGCWLLGDSGYFLCPYLLTPLQQANAEAEVSYNTAHTRTHAIVGRAIGLWKQRFRCVRKTAGGLQPHPTKCCTVVVVTVLLQANVQLPEDEEIFIEDAEEVHLVPDWMHPAGLEVRQQLIANIFRTPFLFTHIFLH